MLIRLDGEAAFLAEALLFLAAAALTLVVVLALVALLTTCFLVALLVALAFATTFFWLVAFLAEVFTDCLVLTFLADDAGFWMVFVTWAGALEADFVLAKS